MEPENLHFQQLGNCWCGSSRDRILRTTVLLEVNSVLEEFPSSPISSFHSLPGLQLVFHGHFILKSLCNWKAASFENWLKAYLKNQHFLCCKHRAEVHTICCLRSTFKSWQPQLPQILRELPWNDGKARNVMLMLDSRCLFPASPNWPREDWDKKYWKELWRLCLLGLPEPSVFSLKLEITLSLLMVAVSSNLNFLNLNWKFLLRSERRWRLMFGRFSRLFSLFPTAGAFHWQLREEGLKEVSQLSIEGREGWTAGWGLAKKM